ncbi:carnosine synthase 1 isoform X2 [Ascaphus truei]
MDPPIFSKDGDINEVWVPGVGPDGPPWGRGPSTETPQGKSKESSGLKEPREIREISEISEIREISESYEDLQRILTNAGLPETEERTKHPRTGHSADSTTLCVLGSPSSAMSVLLEGARQCPGNTLLCLSPSWFCPQPPASAPPLPLYIRQAVTFDLGGRTFLDAFSPPRRVTYLLCLGGAQSLRGEGWDCPMGGSPQLSHLLADTLGVRLLLDRRELPLPPALLLAPPCWSGPWGPQNGEGRKTRLVELDGKPGWEERVREEISTFLASVRMKEHQQVVVKSCGSRWRESFATTFHPSRDVVSVSGVVLGLVRELHEGQGVLLEGFISTLPPRRIRPPQPPAVIPCYSVSPPELAIRLCAVVCRSRGDQPILSKVVCTVGRAEKPLRHCSALPQSLDTTLGLWGVTDKGQKDSVWAQLKETAESSMRAVMEQEKRLTPEERGGRRAQTDLLGVDFLLTLVDHVVTPVILGLTSDLCLESCGIHECLLGSLAAGGPVAMDSAAEPLLELMLRRSMCYVMEGKEILVIGAGGVSKKFIWDAARDYEIKIHLVESDPGHFASALVASFLHYDFEDHSRDEEHARNLLCAVQGRHLSGCMAFWDECTILAAILSRLLGLPGPPPSAVRLAKRKTQTQLRLLAMTSTSPPFPYAGAFAVPCCPLGSGDAGLEKAEAALSYPLVVKPESGAGAVGVRLVQNGEECRKVIGRMGSGSEVAYESGGGVACQAGGGACESGGGVACQAGGGACESGGGVACQAGGGACESGGVACQAGGGVCESGGGMACQALGGGACESGGVACQAGGGSCESGGVACQAGGGSCESGSVACQAGGGSCESGGVACQALGGGACESGGVACHAGGGACESGGVACRALGGGACESVKEVACQTGVGGACEAPVGGAFQTGVGASPLEGDASLPPPLLLSEYVTGSEHDVDLVLGPRGQLLAAYVSDNGPTLLPGFTETAAALPSRLGPERRCQLVQAAVRSCRALGLHPGVFNVELKLTESGPRLLEINPRMGGFYLRDWIRHVYGTDLVLVALALSCGVEPALPRRGARDTVVLVGVMCVGERHEEALRGTAEPRRLRQLHRAGHIRFNRLEGGPEREPDQEPYGNVACEGECQGEARERLLGVCAVLGLDSEEYPVPYLTGEFQ